MRRLIQLAIISLLSCLPLTRVFADEVLAGLGWDHAHNGHGFDLHKSGDQWILYFYTYDEAGNPEWYVGVGEMQYETIAGDFFLIRYDPDQDPPQSADPDFSGRFFLDFSATAVEQACDDGVDRDQAEQVALFEWRIGEETGSWCTELLRFGDGPGGGPYLGGVWYAGEEDPGYGVTMAHMDHRLVAIAYYYDSEGNPRWALGTAAEDDPVVKLNHFYGYCRGCVPQPLETKSAGTLELDWAEGNEPGGGSDFAALHLDYPTFPGGRFEREFTLYRLSDGVPSVPYRSWSYQQPSFTWCDAGLEVDSGFLCAVRPSSLDAATRDVYGSGSSRDQRLGFGYHALAFPPDGSAIRGVYLHLTGTFGRPWNQASGEFANRTFLDEALAAGYITIQLAYDNRFTVNYDDCGNAYGRAVDNCAGDVRREKITGEDVSEVAVTPRADSVEYRLIKLVEYLERQGVDFPYALVRGGRVEWPRLRVGGHSQGATHALYLSKYFEAAHACVLAGGYDVPDDVPFAPPENMADWILDDSVALDLSRIRVITSVSDPSYDAFVAAYAVMGMEKGVHWQEFSGAPYRNAEGKVISGHTAAVKDPRFRSLRVSACFE